MNGWQINAFDPAEAERQLAYASAAQAQLMQRAQTLGDISPDGTPLLFTADAARIDNAPLVQGLQSIAMALREIRTPRDVAHQDPLAAAVVHTALPSPAQIHAQADARTRTGHPGTPGGVVPFAEITPGNSAFVTGVMDPATGTIQAYQINPYQ